MIEPIFNSPAMKAICRVVERIAPSDIPVFITGETGTGKEVIADLIHRLGSRVNQPLIKINCAAIPRELFESELFGAVRGAYTGSHSDRVGLLREANHGTLVLDELVEMPPDLQTKLLRVLQDGLVRPVGGHSVYRINCRFIAMTNMDPQEAIRTRKLRADLYYRVAGYTVELPRLRDRRDDIMPMAAAFLRYFANQSKLKVRGFAPEAIHLLKHYSWPGNVRELMSEVHRAVLVAAHSQVEASDLSPRLMPSVPVATAAHVGSIAAAERETIVQALVLTRGNKEASARRLGIGKQTLYNKIRNYEIKEFEFMPYISPAAESDTSLFRERVEEDSTRTPNGDGVFAA